MNFFQKKVQSKNERSFDYGKDEGFNSLRAHFNGMAKEENKKE